MYAKLFLRQKIPYKHRTDNASLQAGTFLIASPFQRQNLEFYKHFCHPKGSVCKQSYNVTNIIFYIVVIRGVLQPKAIVAGTTRSLPHGVRFPLCVLQKREENRAQCLQ